jgi:hypothetical protein
MFIYLEDEGTCLNCNYLFAIIKNVVTRMQLNNLFQARPRLFFIYLKNVLIRMKCIYLFLARPRL